MTLKVRLRFLLAAGIAGLFLWHFVGGTHGYASQGWDFGAHYSIVEELKHGHFFPELNELTSNENSVSRYLPIYSGLLGAHVLTLILHFVLGLSLTKSMLILSDLAGLVTIICLYQMTRKLVLSRLVAGYLYATQILLLLYQYESGFYAQSIGIAFAYLGFVAENHRIKNSLFVVGGICYPDIFLWVLPMIALEIWQQGRPLDRLKALILWFMFTGLFVVLLVRLKLIGSAEIDWGIYIAVLVAAILSFKTAPQKIKLAVASFVIVSLILLIVSEARFGQFRYYSRKPLYWCPIFLALLLPYFHRRAWLGILLVPLFASVVWDFDVISRQAKMVVMGQGIFNSDQEIQIRKIVQEQKCSDGLFLPNKVGRSATLLQILNAITGRTDFAKIRLRAGRLGDDFALTSPDHAYELTKKLPAPRVVQGDWSLYCPAEVPELSEAGLAGG